MNVDWWLVAWGLAMQLVALAFMVLYGHEHNRHVRENMQLKRERNDARSQRDKLNLENEQLAMNGNKVAKRFVDATVEVDRLQHDNELFVDTIDEQRREIERLKKSVGHATVPLVEAVSEQAEVTP